MICHCYIEGKLPRPDRKIDGREQLVRISRVSEVSLTSVSCANQPVVIVVANVLQFCDPRKQFNVEEYDACASRTGRYYEEYEK